MSEKRNSSLLGKITILVMVGLCVNTAVALDGSGTQEEPWLIQSLEDFNDFAADANYWDDYTRLETDVNLAGMVYERAVIAPDVSSSDYYQGTKYTGVFDGNDHKILNLTIDDGGAGNDWIGLFGEIDNGEVRNLGLEGGSVSGSGVVGGLMGGNSFGSVSKCYSTGDVNGDDSVGGLIGSKRYSSVSNCYSTGDVSGTGDAVGGLVGYTLGLVANCYSTGNVSGDDWFVGGLIGYNNDGSVISNCYSTGDVNGDVYVGGLVGTNSGNVSNCYSTSDVNGVEDVGGLVGSSFGYVRGCFWDIDSQTHGITESIGLNGGPVTNVEGLPTAQMQTRSTFTDANWDFINVWNIGENQTYPYLRTVSASDINKDHITNFFDLGILCNQWLKEP